MLVAAMQVAGVIIDACFCFVLVECMLQVLVTDAGLGKDFVDDWLAWGPGQRIIGRGMELVNFHCGLALVDTTNVT